MSKLNVFNWNVKFCNTETKFYVNKDKNGDIGHVFWSRVIEDELFIEKFKSLIKSKKCLN